MAWTCLAHKASGSSRVRLLGDACLACRRHYGAPAATPPTAAGHGRSKAERKMKQPAAMDRDVLVSVLEASATSREAKSYLQKYASKPKPKPRPDSPQFVQGVARDGDELPGAADLANVAIVTLRLPQHLAQDTLDGIAKTLSQLRLLGLLAIVIVDCGADGSRQALQDEALRLCKALGSPAAKLAGDIFVRRPARRHAAAPSCSSPIFSDQMRVDDQGLLHRALRRGLITVVPSLARPDDISCPRPADACEMVLSLTKYLTGMQFESPGDVDATLELRRPAKVASVERIIILDPLGGTPMLGRPGVCYRFVNLEQEYTTLMQHLSGRRSSWAGHDGGADKTGHAANLILAKDCLSLLPSSSSALVTTPLAAANTQPDVLSRPAGSGPAAVHSAFGFAEMVATRRQRNPLLHNLLTDRPVSSPSLPLPRWQAADARVATTLVKRGMPVTIYPDPKVSPWRPPRPGSPRLRLTDTCIDLPRLVHLIEDSFNRRLDVQDYLERVEDKVAGIIIAGEYEGGAILTWERPAGVGDEREAHGSGRLVPYLDKFAVLKSRQGSAGVADIVFNAMVQDCFPDGVCWRSRKDNPVNKWYFERSSGTCKLAGCNWTMFWTTLGLGSKHPTLGDYEAICRGVQPSWADGKTLDD